HLGLELEAPAQRRLDLAPVVERERVDAPGDRDHVALHQERRVTPPPDETNPPLRARRAGRRGGLRWRAATGWWPRIKPPSRGEGLQSGALVALAQPAQRAVAQLTDALARHAEQVADLL